MGGIRERVLRLRGASSTTKLITVRSLAQTRKHLPLWQVLSDLGAIDAGINESSLKAKASLRGA